jgi:hypothetical protein
MNTLLWSDIQDLCSAKKFPKVTETPPDTKRFTDDEIRKLLSTVPPGFVHRHSAAVRTPSIPSVPAECMIVSNFNHVEHFTREYSQWIG